MLGDHRLPTFETAVLFVQAIMFSVLGLLSIVAIVGSIANSRSASFICAKMFAIHLFLTIVSVAFVLYATLRPISNADVQSCLASSTDELVIEFCEKGFSILKALPIMFLGIVIFVQLYAYIILVNYTEKLDVDEAASIIDYAPSEKKWKSNYLDV